MSNTGKGLIGLGILIAAVGALFFVVNGNNHNICSSVLVSGQPSCSGVNLRYDGGLVAMIIGGVVFLGGAILARSPGEASSPASSTPADWYPDPHNNRKERWWTGNTWSDEIRTISWSKRTFRTRTARLLALVVLIGIGSALLIVVLSLAS